MYQLNQLKTTASGGGPEFAISVWDRADWSYARATQLSSQFVQLRATPRVQLTSLRKVTSVHPSPRPDRRGWSLTLPATWAADVALQIEILPPATGSALLGCSVAAATAQVSRRQRALPVARGAVAVYNATVGLPRPPIGATSTGTANDGSNSVTLVRAVAVETHQHACRPSELSLVLQPTNLDTTNGHPTTNSTSTPVGLVLSNGLPPANIDDASQGEHGSYHYIPDVLAWACDEVGLNFSTTAEIGGSDDHLPLCSLLLGAMGMSGELQLLAVVPLLISYRTELLFLLSDSSAGLHLFHFLAEVPPLVSSSAHTPPVPVPAELRELTGALLAGQLLAESPSAVVTDVRISVSVPQPCAELASSTGRVCVFVLLQRQLISDSSPGAHGEVYHQCGDLQQSWLHRGFGFESLPDLGSIPALCPGSSLFQGAHGGTS